MNTESEVQAQQEEEKGQTTETPFTVRNRNTTTAAKEVNKVGTDLLTIEKEKLQLLRGQNSILLRIADGIEELVSVKRAKYS